MTGAGDDHNLQPRVMLQLAFAVINIFHRNEFILVTMNKDNRHPQPVVPGIEPLQFFFKVTISSFDGRKAPGMKNLSGEYVNA